MPIQALDHFSKVNVDGMESKCWPASSASHPCPNPSGYNPLGSAAGEETPEERSLLPCIARDEKERETHTEKQVSNTPGVSFPFAL